MLVILRFVSVCVIAWSSCGFATAMAQDEVRSAATVPAIPNFQPTSETADHARKWQGISGMEVTSSGRLWATWYGGGLTEDRHNYVMVVTSGDDGKTWSDLKLVIDPDGDGPVRAFDPVLWIDPAGKLWLFWGQSLMPGAFDPAAFAPYTFAMFTENPDDENPIWSKPQFVHAGVMMNKPTVLSDGTWLLPMAEWFRPESCRVVSTTDNGKTWTLRGTANVPSVQGRNCDEPMIVERKDGSLWQWIRTTVGIGESVSNDGGRTWSESVPSAVLHTASRFFIRRLKSGNLLLVKHGAVTEKTGRSHLMAFLSDDDGKTWQGGLMLDERAGVSYPDGAESKEGVIYITYDFDRSGQKTIYMATFTENDILAGKDVSGKVRLREVINQATGVNPKVTSILKSTPILYARNSGG